MKFLKIVRERSRNMKRHRDRKRVIEKVNIRVRQQHWVKFADVAINSLKSKLFLQRLENLIQQHRRHPKIIKQPRKQWDSTKLFDLGHEDKKQRNKNRKDIRIINRNSLRLMRIGKKRENIGQMLFIINV